MITNWNIDDYVKNLTENEIEDALKLIGDHGVTWAEKDFWNYSYSDLTKKQSGNLRNNLSYATSTSESSPSFGEAVERPPKGSVHIGGIVEYLMRYCLGFGGFDELGRFYDQASRPILQNIIDKQKQGIIKILGMVKK
jgi:hypothetical protein